MEFNLIDLKLEIQTANVAALCHRLLFSGEEFAEACKRETCGFPFRQCTQCPSCATCDWQFIFGQKLSPDPEALRRHQKPPLPFAFSFPMPDTQDDGAGVLECGLVVVGRAISCLDVLLSGFDALLAPKQGECGTRLLSTASRDYQGTLNPLAHPANHARSGNLAIMSADNILISCPRECSNIKVRLVSPLRLVFQGHQLNRFNFSNFARSTMRRVSSLAYHYCGYEFNCDFKSLAMQTQSVLCREDCFTTTIGKSWKTAGITGHGRFCGDFGELLPFLILGQYVHTGKNASFGMGAFELDLD